MSFYYLTLLVFFASIQMEEKQTWQSPTIPLSHIQNDQ